MSNNLFNLDSAMSEFVAKSKDAVNELQKIDTCLKHIQQTDKSLSDSDLVNIGTQAYELQKNMEKVSQNIYPVLKHYQNPAIKTPPL